MSKNQVREATASRHSATSTQAFHVFRNKATEIVSSYFDEFGNVCLARRIVAIRYSSAESKLVTHQIIAPIDEMNAIQIVIHNDSTRKSKLQSKRIHVLRCEFVKGFYNFFIFVF